MGVIDMRKAREEFLVFLRNSDILSTTQRGVTTKTDNFSATLSQTVFTLNSANTRNIRSVAVNTLSHVPYADYTPAYNTGTSSTITFLSELSLGDAVAVQYDYSSGATEKIWPDYPEILYLPTSCPRMGFDFISMRTEPIGIGTVNWLTDALVRIKFYDLGNYLSIDNFITTLRTKIKAAQKSFYHFKIARISGMGPVNPVIENVGSKKVFERDIDVTMRFSYET